MKKGAKIEKSQKKPKGSNTSSKKEIKEKEKPIEEESKKEISNTKENEQQNKLKNNSTASLKNSNNDLHTNSEPNAKNDDYQAHMLTKNEIKQYTHLLFLNMAKFSEKDNDYFISQQSLIKLLKENGIISDKMVKLSEIDILFKSISPKSLKLNSSQFLTFLLRLAQKIYPEEFKENPKQTINFFLGNLFENYADILNSEKIPLEAVGNNSCQYKTIETLLSYVPDEKQIYIINRLLFTITEIYIKYFIFELEESTDLARKSVKNLISFSRDFEVLPYIINETQLVTYYHLSINNNSNNVAIIDAKYNQGESFTLNNFCIFLIHFSLLSYTKNIKGTSDTSQDSEASKLLMFLERLETSKGMKTFTRKLNRPSANKLSLIPPKEVFIQLGELNEFDNFNYSPQTAPIMNRTFSNLSNNNNTFICDNTNMKRINDNIDGLERTFLFFGRIGDKLNFDQMSLSSYVKFLKHCSLMMEINAKDKKKFNLISKDMLEKSKTRNTTNNNNYYSPINNLSQDELHYKRTLAKIVNSANDINNSNENCKLGESDVNVIFSLLTGPRNFDSSLYTKAQMDKNSGYCTSFGTNANNTNNTMNPNGSSSDVKMLRMNFKTFLKSFDLIACRLYPNEDRNTALSKVLNENIIPNLIPENFSAMDMSKSNISKSNLNNTNIVNNVNFNNIEGAYEKICGSDEIKQFLKKLSEPIATYYQYYCNEKNSMLEFSNLYEFYKNFALFPDIINLIQLKNIFSFLTSIKKSSNEKIKQDQTNASLCVFQMESKSYITFSDFLYSLAITAMLFDFDDNFSDIDKLLYLVERMNQSLGIKKCQLQSGRT